MAERPAQLDRWPLHEQIEWLAAEMAATQFPGPPMMVVYAWAAALEDVAEAVRARNSTTATSAVDCGTRQHGGTRGEQCDRPTNHGGDHSWEADRQRRVAREYEFNATTVLSETRRELERERARTTQLRARVEQLETMPRWRRRRVKADRG